MNDNKMALKRIAVGLAGWGDHDSLYAPGTAQKDKLARYAEHFSIVEMDSSFYAVQPPDRMARYAQITPDGFSFIVKAYQETTGHLRGKSYYNSEDELFAAMRESLLPLQSAGKLKAVLFQFPPWFDCTKDNVRLLRETKRRMAGFPCALEFRHQSWYSPAYREKTLAFVQEEGWIHTVCDEPQAGEGSIPIVPEATNKSFTLVRMHGRNVSGWNRNGAENPGDDAKDRWRAVRYLYDYNEAELSEWKERIYGLLENCAEVGIIFNNNSGGHAAGNARQFMRMLGMNVAPLAAPAPAPEQLDLFHLSE